MARQSRLVKVSVALTVAMIVAGLVNGVLSTITFKNREPRRDRLWNLSIRFIDRESSRRDDLCPEVYHPVGDSNST